MKHLRLQLFFLTPCALLAASPGAAGSWIPARWTGGPLELYQRARAKTVPPEPAVRDAIASWYDPATLHLLEGSPVNCLLVTFSAGADVALERRQQQLVKAYTTEAHRRGITVLGLVYAGSDAATLVALATEARLDGLVLDGEFPTGFAGQLAKTWAIPILKDAAQVRTSKEPLLAVEGVSPSARNLADLGIRGAPSSEPWIQSNVWLVRSFRLVPAWRPVWISYQPDGGSPVDYARSVADAAVAGGRWIVALDDRLRANLHRGDAAALATWRSIGACLKFAEEHAEWRTFAPYGNVGIVVDTDAAEEYLKLVARRQVPYRLILRSQLGAGTLAGFRAVVAAELDRPSGVERKILQAFAEQGGLVVAGPWWGGAPRDQPYAEVPAGKGRVAIYKEPGPELIAREMRELLSHQEMGVVAFNVPSVITYASGDSSGKRLLVQLLNYSNSPASAITIRVSGRFRTAHLFTPEAAPVDLAMTSAEGQTDVTIPKLTLWGGLILE